MKSIAGKILRGGLLGGALVMSTYIPQASATPVSPTYVTVGNTQWAQASLFDNLSWNDVAAVCDSTTGACNGTLSGTDGTLYDLTGWTWASQQDATTLYNTFLPSTDQLQPSNGYYINNPSPAQGETQAIYTAGFQSTAPPPDLSNLIFYPPSYSFIERTHAGQIYNIAQWIYPGILQPNSFEVSTSGLYGDDSGWSYNYVGVEFLRQATVPEPPTLALLGLGLAGMGLVRHRKNVRKGQ